MTKKHPDITRRSLTKTELENLTLNELLQLKATDEEKSLLREITQEKEVERQARTLRLEAEAAPILAELRAAGIRIGSVGDLVTRSERYQAAIPVLLKHLLMPYSDAIRETLARSLAVPETAVQKAWPILVAEYRKAPIGRGITASGDAKEYSLGAKNGLACALSAAVTDETLKELISLIKDRTHGESRLLLLSGIRKSKSILATQAIKEVASDPDLSKEIASWRRKK
jgi:hypothetical protein